MYTANPAAPCCCLFLPGAGSAHKGAHKRIHRPLETQHSRDTQQRLTILVRDNRRKRPRGTWTSHKNAHPGTSQLIPRTENTTAHRGSDYNQENHGVGKAWARHKEDMAEGTHQPLPRASQGEGNTTRNTPQENDAQQDKAIRTSTRAPQREGSRSGKPARNGSRKAPLK